MLALSKPMLIPLPLEPESSPLTPRISASASDDVESPAGVDIQTIQGFKGKAEIPENEVGCGQQKQNQQTGEGFEVKDQFLGCRAWG